MEKKYAKSISLSVAFEGSLCSKKCIFFSLARRSTTTARCSLFKEILRIKPTYDDESALRCDDCLSLGGD
jgi:hypothetical protein